MCLTITAQGIRKETLMGSINMVQSARRAVLQVTMITLMKLSTPMVICKNIITVTDTLMDLTRRINPIATIITIMIPKRSSNGKKNKSSRTPS